MPSITVAAQTISNFWQRSETTGELRIYATETFTASDGTEIPASDSFLSDKCYQKVTLTISGDDVTIPQFTIYSTNDILAGNEPKYIARYFAGTGVSAIPLGIKMVGGKPEFEVPSTPTSTTWQNLAIYNDATKRKLNDRFLTADQIAATYLTQTDADATYLYKPYVATASVRVRNTVTETSLYSATAVGSKVISGMRAGSTVRIRMKGIITTSGTPTFAVNPYLNGNALSGTSDTFASASLLNQNFDINIDIICYSRGSSGEIILTGNVSYTTSTGQGRTYALSQGAYTIDTTADITPDIKFQWGTAHTSNDLFIYHSAHEFIY